MAVVNIANRAQLLAALQTAVGGETFILAAGNYGDVSISGRNFANTITFQSQNTASMASFTRFDITSSSNITLNSVDIGRTLPAASEAERMSSIWGSSNISFNGVKVHGSLDGNPRNDGWGILVSDSANVSIKASDFTELYRGAVFQRSTNVTVEANSFHDIRSDGVDFTAVSNVLIKNNMFRDFYFFGGDHPDAIQFWTSGQTRGSSNITISGNQIFQGNGLALQGIFFNDEVGNLPYQNVVIDNNMVYGNDLWHGIAMTNGRNVSITNNTVVSRTNDDPYFWIRADNTQGLTIARNVTDAVVIGPGSSGVSVANNIELRLNPAALQLLPNLNKAPGLLAAADLIMSGYGYQLPETGSGGGAAPPPSSVPPEGGNTRIIYGTNGNDTIRGTAANEIIYGVPATGATPGRDSVDKLYGGGGADIFVLGDARGAFYNDGNAMWSGRKDYAQIMDFSSDDRIQLSGALTDYVFRRETVGGSVGTSIFRDTNGDRKWDNADELIGHVANVSLNTNQLIFVPAGTGSSKLETLDTPVGLLDRAPDSAAIRPEPANDDDARPLPIPQVANMPDMVMFSDVAITTHFHHFAIA